MKTNKGFVAIIIGIFVAAALLGGGYYWYLSRTQQRTSSADSQLQNSAQEAFKDNLSQEPELTLQDIQKELPENSFLNKKTEIIKKVEVDLDQDGVNEVAVAYAYPNSTYELGGEGSAETRTEWTGGILLFKKTANAFSVVYKKGCLQANAQGYCADGYGLGASFDSRDVLDLGVLKADNGTAALYVEKRFSLNAPYSQFNVFIWSKDELKSLNFSSPAEAKYPDYYVYRVNSQLEKNRIRYNELLVKTGGDKYLGLTTVLKFNGDGLEVESSEVR